MVAIVSGNSLGLELTSLRTLGQQGVVGDASHGRRAEAVYVNAANGNLVLQDRDGVLVARGPDEEVLRTYNSQGVFDGDNGDNWTDGVAPLPLVLAGTLNAAGSTLTRTDRDGSAATYAWSAWRNAYFTTEGDGAYDTISFVAADNQLEWKDGATGATQRYAATGPMRMLSSRDSAGDGLVFAYDALGRLASCTASNGDVTFYDRTGANLAQVRTVTAQGVSTVQVQYGYDTANRLASVSVNLGASGAYTTNYTYDGTSNRVASLAQSDGTRLGFTYVQVAGAYRVLSVADALGTATSFAYDAAGHMVSTTTAGLTTAFNVDTSGRLAGVTPPGSAQRIVGFGYDTDGNVLTVTDGASRVTTFGYDTNNGNRTLERDAAGNTVERFFDARNQVLWECRYTTADPDGAGSAQPGGPVATRYVYDSAGRNQLRFTVSPEGRVVENRYDNYPNAIATLVYASTCTLPANLARDGLTLDFMLAWAATPGTAVAQRIDTAFDARGQVQSRTTYSRLSGSAGIADGTQSVEQFVYDQRGLLLQRIAPSNGVTTYTYDAFGRELSRRDAAGQVTVTQYQDQVTQRTTTVTAANGLVTTSTFDAAGRLVSTLQSSAATANLGQTAYAYDGAGRLRMTTDPTGVRHWWLWDGAGRCVGEVDGNGTLVESVYDTAGLLVSKTTYATAVDMAQLVDVNGNAITSATLASIRSAAMAASAANVVEWRSYDGAGRLWRMARTVGTGALAAVTEYAYDGMSRLVTQTAYATQIGTSDITAAGIPQPPLSASQDRVTRNFYDGENHLVGTLDAEGYLVKLAYDGAGQLSERIAFATATAPGFRAAGTLAQVTPGANANDQRTVSFHDAKGQLIAQVDAEGYMTETTYDANGRAVGSVRYANRVTAAFTPASAPSTFRPAASGADQSTARAYDSLGRVVLEVTPDGVATSFAYDTAGHLVSTVRAVGTPDERSVLARYDLQGRKTAELTAQGAALLANAPSQSAIEEIWTKYGLTHTYDAAGRRTSTADDVGHKTFYYYDADGALVFSVNALGEVQEFRYDVLGRQTVRSQHATRVSVASLTGGLITPALQTYLSAVSAGDVVETVTYTRDGQVASRTDAAGGATTFTLNAFAEVIGTTQLIGATGQLLTTLSVDRRGQQVAVAQDPAGLNLVRSAAYDAFGREIRAIDANGKATTRAYDRLGRTVVVTDPMNASRVTTYDAFARVLTQTDPLGGVTSYAYDTAARTVSVTTPEGITTKTVSNAHGQVLTVTDGKGQVTSHTYDRNGKLLKTTTPLSPATSTASTYDVAGRMTSSTDANERATTYTYDAADRVLTRTVDAGGLALLTRWEYDATGRAVSTTDANNVVTTYAYDNAGRVLRQTVDPTGLNLSTVYTYDNRGKTLSVTSPRTFVTEFTYDAAGRRTREVIDPTGLAISRSWTYDAEGHAVSATDATGNVTRYAYDAAGRLACTVDAAGGVLQQVYDAAGRLTRTTAYATPIALAGLASAASVADIQAQVTPQATDRVEHRVYDRDGRLAATVDGTGAVVQFTYDRNGNVVARTAFANRITLAGWQAGTVPVPQGDAAHDQKTTYVHDALDRVVFTMDAMGAVVGLTYDGNGNVLRRIAYARPVTLSGAATQASLATAVVADGEHDAVVRNTYDAANRLTWTVDGTGAVVQRSYDGNGNVVVQTAYANSVGPTNPASSVQANATADRVTTRFYDAGNRLVYEVDPLKAVREWNYDEDGNVLRQVAYANAAASVASPFGSNAVADMRSRLTISSADRGTRFAFDAAGRVIGRMDAEGAVTKTQYDAAGRPVATTVMARRLYWPAYAGNPLTSLMRLINADPADRTTVRAYDAAGRVAYEVGAMGEVTGYRYDGTGRVLRSTRYATLLPAGTGRSAAQIESALVSNAASDRTETSAYDAAGNLVTSTDANGVDEKFTYDAVGGKLTYTNRKGSTWLYDHDAAGRLTQETSPQVELTASSVDPSGNVATTTAASAPVITRFAYDALGNLASRTEAVGRPEQRTTRYEYDALGRQVRVIHPTVGTYAAELDNLAVNGSVGVALRTETVSPRETRTFYDTLGNAVAARDAGDALTQKVYDRAGRVEYDIDALGQVTGYTRNVFGEVMVLTRFARGTALGNANVTGAASSATRAQVLAALVPSATLDRAVMTSYDRNGRVTSVVEPSELTFDPEAAAGMSTVRVGKTTVNTYNAFGQVMQVFTVRNGAEGRNAVTARFFDRSGQEVATVDAMGYVTLRQFDARGNLVEVREVAAAAGTTWTPAAATPAASVDDRITRYTYDRLDRKTTERRVAVEFSTASNGTSTRGDLVTSYGYDAVGNLTRTTDAAGGSTYTAYDALGRVLAVAAPVRSSTVSGSALTPVTTFRRDAFGNVVVQTESAAGAASASESAIVVGADPADRITGTAYDAFGRAAASVDAMGSTSYTSYDAWGHVAKSWRGVTGLDGVLRTTYQVSTYDKVGELVQVVEPAPASTNSQGTLQQTGTATTTLEYNAFGELTRKVAQGGRDEYFDYDTAGRLWRTNTGDGIDRIRLFDAQGNATAEILSDGVGGSNRDLRSFADAAMAAAAPNLRRTDITYDLLGRVTSRTLPTRADSSSAAVVQRAYVGAAIAESATPLRDVDNILQGWSGTNRLNLSWNNVAGLGSGEMQIHVDYVTTNVDSRAGIQRGWDSGVIDASAGASSFAAVWTDPIALDGGIARVLRVTVLKKEVNGTWVTVVDQAPGYGGNTVDVTSPADHGVEVRLELRAAGSAGDTGWWRPALVGDFGNLHRFDASALPLGGYEYRLKLVAPSLEERVAASGSLNMAKPPLAAIATPLLFGPAGPGVLSWAPPGASTGQAFRYRAAGSTGAWSSLSVLPRNAGAADGVDTSALGPGTYQFELLWTPSGSGVPASHATGQFTIVAAQPSRWIPPVNLPPIAGLRVVGNAGGPLQMVWDPPNFLTSDSVARIRPIGGSWSSLPVDYSAQTLDQYGQPAGYQMAVLGVRAPGTYEIQVTSGSPPLNQATAVLTVYAQTPGYVITQWEWRLTSAPVIIAYQNGYPVYATDEYGNVLYQDSWVLTPVQYWIPGSTPPPSVAITTPPYTPGYWTTATPAQYGVSVSASPGTQEISGSEGSTLAQGVASAEGARSARPVIQQKTDRWGNVVEITDPRFAGWKTTYRFNAFDRVVKETRPATAAGVAVTETSYDALGRQVAVRDALGNVNGQVFDAGGNLVQERHADNGVVQHRYDAFGNRVSTTDAEGLLTTFTFDSLGRLLSRKQGAVAVYTVSTDNWAVGGALSQLSDAWTYDQLGRKVTQSNGNGEILRYAYDLRGNVVETRQPLGQAVRATYDVEGHKTWEVDANGRQATWSYNSFGRMASHLDIGGATYTYTYDNARQLVSQTNTRGQSIAFAYDAAGQQTGQYDSANGKASTFTYDLAGRKVRETLVQGGVTYQDNHLSYDALGNLRDVADARVHVSIDYDLAGNRSRVATFVNYQGVAGATTQSANRYFKYDAMNRQTVVDAIDASGNLGTQGHALVYDMNGNRKSDRWQTVGAGGALASTTEQYTYDAMNRLQVVTRGGKTIDTRSYDGAGRVVRSGPVGALSAADAAALNQGVAASDAVSGDTRINRYDANGRLLHQKVLDTAMQAKSDVIWDPTETAGWFLPAAGYDAAGNTLGWAVRNWQSGPAISAYQVELQQFEGYVAKTSAGAGTAIAPVMTTQQYDANGFLVGVIDPSRADRSRTFVNDGAGRVLATNQAGRIQRQLIVDGEVLGTYGVGADPATSGGNPNFANVADFDFGYSRISASYPGAAPGAYQVRPGDTLQSVAQSAYGDGKLWYRIADANGLASSTALKVGQTLNIPTGVGTINNNAGTFKPYDASRMVGDTNPLVMPMPAGDGAGCGGMGKLLMVVVAVAVTAATGGAGGAINSFWASLFGSSAAAVTATTIATAATAAAVGAIASQAVGMVTGDVRSLNWKGVALQALSGGVTQGLSLSDGVLASSTVARAAVANAMSQGIGVVTGLQRKFDWTGVAASFIGAGVGQAVGDALGVPINGARAGTMSAENILKSALKGMAAGLATAAARGGGVAMQQVAIDAFGDAWGQGIADRVSQAGVPPPVSADEKAAILQVFEDGPGIDSHGGGINLARLGGDPRLTGVLRMSSQRISEGNVALVSGSGDPHPPHSAFSNQVGADAVDEIAQELDSSKKLWQQTMQYKLGLHFQIAKWAIDSPDLNAYRSQITRQDWLNFGTGIQYPDMPASMARIEIMGIGEFGVDYEETEFRIRSGRGVDTKSPIYRTHFGDKQFWHFMSPNAALTNYQVQQLSVDQCMEWFRSAQLDRENAFKYLGAIGHTIADSWSAAHAIRGADGLIQQVQGYLDQNHSAHGTADLVNGEMIQRYGRVQDVPAIQMPIRLTTELIRKYFEFQSTTSFTERVALETEVRDWLNREVFPLDPRFASRPSGGSAPAYGIPSGRIVPIMPPQTPMK